MIYGESVLDQITSTKGLKQGDIISPLLFNLVMGSILK